MPVTIHLERLDALDLVTITFCDFLRPLRLLDDEIAGKPELLKKFTELLENYTEFEESEKLEEVESDMSACNES